MSALVVDPNLDFTPIARAAEGYAGRAHFPTLVQGLSGTCLVSAAESKGAVSLFHVVVAAGAGVPPPVHQQERAPATVSSDRGTSSTPGGASRPTAAA